MSTTTGQYLLVDECRCATTSPPPPPLISDSSMILREEHHPLCRGADEDDNGEQDAMREEANGKRPPSRLGGIALKLILIGLVLLVFEPSDEDDSSSASPITNNASTRVMFHQSRPWGNTISMIAFYFAGSVIYSEVLMDRLLLAQSNNDNSSRSGNNNLSSILVMHLPELLLVALLGLVFGFRKNGFGGDVAYFTFSCFTPWLVAVNDALMVVVPDHNGSTTSDCKRTTSQSYHSIARLALPLALLLATHATLFRDTETAIEFFRSPSYVNYCLSTTFMTCYFFRHVAAPYLFGINKNAEGVALLVQLLVMVPPTAIMVFPLLINANDDDYDGSDHGVFLACDYLIHTTICLDVVVLLCFCAKMFVCRCFFFCCNKGGEGYKAKKETRTTTKKQQQQQQQGATARTLSSDDDDYVLMVDNASCTSESTEV